MSPSEDRSDSVVTDAVDEVVVLQVSGDVDLRTSDALRDHGIRLLDGEAGALVLDLSDVPFFASSGIAALAHFHQHNASGRRIPIHLVANRHVRRTLQRTAMDTLVPLHDTRTQAVDAARKALG
ncbi:hypothetical protein SUDANB95_02729 [Actinosynnema sp. ALI-1.44]